MAKRPTFLGRILPPTLLIGSAVGLWANPAASGFRSSIPLLLSPISWPAHELSSRISANFQPAPPIDPASPDEPRDTRAVYRENAELRLALVSVMGQLEKLKALHADRMHLGTSILARCTPAKVIGVTTSAEGDLLQLGTTDLGTFKVGQPVLHYNGNTGGIAGRVMAAGPGGAQVRLVSSVDSKFVGRFFRFEEGHPIQLPIDPLVIEGAGDGEMRAGRLRQQQAEEAKLRAGDWVVLDDSDWDEQLRGFRVGTVTGVSADPKEPGFAIATIEPAADLKGLRDVMVMTK